MHPFCLIFFTILLCLSPGLWSAERPNIVWIVAEDMSAHFSCYGETAIRTPNVDQLAAEGTRFSHTYVTAPICSTARSALITGMYQTSIGAHHHRSGRGTVKINLPAGVVPIPALFKQAGYWTCNADWPVKPSDKGLAKTDYNFQWDQAIYDGNDWSARKPGQPFFAQIQLWGGKVRDSGKAAEIFRKQLGDLTPSEKLTLPPYYPRTSAMLSDWALTLDACRLVDLQIGEICARLKKEGIFDNTVIMFITDHGVSHARGKQFLYDEGTHIPFIVRGPGIPRGAVRLDLVEHIDLAATSLAIAGIAKPNVMQARDVFAENYQPREAIYCARDRADETVDYMRSIRTERWLYIRNHLPNRPHLQPNHYKDNKRCVVALREAEKEGLFNELHKSLFLSPIRPAEELYDYRADQFQINNLATDPSNAEVLSTLRAQLTQWAEQTNDQGRIPESQMQYDSDMKAYMKTNRTAQLISNIELMKKWASEGK